MMQIRPRRGSGFRLALLDEARALSGEITARGVRQSGRPAQPQVELRNRLLTLLAERLSTVRRAARHRVTRAFEGAIVRGRVTRPALDPAGRLTVRLQGVDAPELHYRSQAARAPGAQSPVQRQLFLAWNHDFRQHWAESATWALCQLISRAGRLPLPCTVVTRIEAPDEAFDCYGCLVGDILVRLDRAEVNLNRWLARQGWALPAFYSSMSAAEIGALSAAADAAYAEGLGLWPSLQDKLGRLRTSLRYRRNATLSAPPADAGPLILPKLYRRQVTWTINRKAKMLDRSFRQYLKERRDACFLTAEFLEQGVTASRPRMLDEFVGVGGVVGIWPEEVVFQEAAATLVGRSWGEVLW